MQKVLVFIPLLLFSSISVAGQNRLLTLDDLYDPARKVNFNGKQIPSYHWMNDSRHYYYQKKQGGRKTLVKENARSGESVKLFEAADLEAAFLSRPEFQKEDVAPILREGHFTVGPGEQRLLIEYGGDLYLYLIDMNRLTRLTHGGSRAEIPEFSPSGEMVAFVRNSDLNVVACTDSSERRLTADASETLLNGKLDWVYQEEIYGRGDFKGFWWSPDSRFIAFLQLNEARVPRFTVVDHLPVDLGVETAHYPKAGDPNPEARLGIVRVSDGKTTWADLDGFATGDILIVDVSWNPDSDSVLLQVQNREQTWLELVRIDPDTGKATPLIRESSNAWVNRLAEPFWLKDGSLLWQSERTGFRHIYHYSAKGKLLGTVTSGPWEVRELEGVSKSGEVFFSGTKESPLELHLYKVALDGTGLKRLSRRSGTHSADFSPDASLYIDRWSDITTPTQVRVFASQGSEIRLVEENSVEALREYRLSEPEFLKIKTGDGFVMEAMMIRPPDFESKLKYPVMSYTYGGPHSPKVLNRWGGTTYLWHQMLAQKGYIIWICDNRSASGKGVESSWPVYHKLGEVELRDLEDGLRWLKGQPWVDRERIGLWGWSYGGFMTAYALTHSKSFRIGISGAPVSDWALYDSVYTERYMGRPQKNVEGYRKSSVLNAAGNLSGKLLLIHGTIDDNVHLQNSIQLIDALQKVGKQFELMLYPKSRHGVRDPLQVMHLRTLMTHFILDNL